MSKKKIVAILLASSFAVLATGNTLYLEDDIDVWYAASTEKILQSYQYSEEEKGDAAFYISMAQNEVEGGQLILNSANDASYDIEVSDLVNGENVIPKENIDIYHEIYVQTTYASDRGGDYFATVMNIPRGQFPDALVPFDAAKKYGENQVLAGKNQGLWIDVKSGIAEETPAGDYVGEIKVTIGSKKVKVPVKVTVWDFEIPTETHMRTLFHYYRDYIFEGEGASSNDMMEKYYEFFLDYRVNLSKLPALGNETQEMIALVKRYAEDERVSTWSLPTMNHQEYRTPVGETSRPGEDLSYVRQMELVTALAYESVKDGKNYLAKAVNYDIRWDEYTLSSRTYQRENAAQWFEMFRQACFGVTQMFDNIYGPEYLDSVEGLRDSIDWLPNLSVAEYNSTSYGIAEYTNVWCPSIRGLMNSGLENVKEALYSDRTTEFGEVQKNKELWSYTCNWPSYPFPTYHIDDILYSSRLYSWMMYDYEIAGNLYYLSYTAKDHSATTETELFDPYTTARGPEANGDGYLVYPGSYYGIDGPVGTMRLTSIRDGAEEYEYLYLLDKLYEEMKDYYGIESLSYKNAYNDIAASLYNNGKLLQSTRGENVLAAREKLAQLIQALKSDEHLIIESEYTEGNYKYISILMSDDAVVESNPYLVNKEKAGQGYRYNFKIDISGEEKIDLLVKYSINGEQKQYVKMIKKASSVLSAFNSQATLSYVNVSKGGTKELATLEGKPAIKLTVQTNPLQASYKPWFTILLKSIPNVTSKELQFGVYVAGTTSKKVNLVYKLSTYDSAAIELTLNPGWNNINLDLGAYNLANVEMIAFYMENVGNSHELYLGELKQYEN